MTKLFGTDGIRGIANDTLTAEFALKLGKAVGVLLRGENENDENIRVCIGTDTRKSLFMLESGIVAGLTSVGIDVYKLDVISTPGVSYIITENGFDAGIMITASHNPWRYNGIKVMNEKGVKFSTEKEEKIEELLEKENLGEDLVSPDLIGKVENIHFESVEKYAGFVLGVFPQEFELREEKLNVLIDVANGSAVSTVHDIFSRLPIEYDVINEEPDGKNINENSGSMYINSLAKKVLEGGYDLGVAFDGDADRVLFVDKDGQEVDGDQVIAILGMHYKEHDKLAENTLVGTVMSNLGLFKMAQANGINLIVTAVGDKYVVEEMHRGGYVLGGEQSGHIIIGDKHRLGDGQLCAVMILGIMISKEKSLRELASVMEKYPQVLMNISIPKNIKYTLDNDVLKRKSAEIEEKLGDNGRILIRASGTEPLIRVMVEGRDEQQITGYAQELIDAIKKSLE